MNDRPLFQFGMDLDMPSAAQTEEKYLVCAEYGDGTVPPDHFVSKDGVCFAGTHLIIDLVGARAIDDIPHVEEALKECVEISGATLLHIHLHHFTPNNGVSGVAVLAESHISIHTWPEREYAALDVFMCGDARPHECIAVLKRAFAPRDVRVTELLRGRNL